MSPTTIRQVRCWVKQGSPDQIITRKTCFMILNKKESGHSLILHVDRIRPTQHTSMWGWETKKNVKTEFIYFIFFSVLFFLPRIRDWSWFVCERFMRAFVEKDKLWSQKLSHRGRLWGILINLRTWGTYVGKSRYGTMVMKWCRIVDSIYLN